MKKTDLSRFENKWYHPGASPVKRLLWYYTNEIFFKSAFFPLYGMKSAILRLFGAKVGVGVIIKPCVNIKSPWRLTIGDYSWIGENSWIDNQANVSIGANVCISQGAMLLTGNHNYKAIAFDLIIGDIVLEDGSWVGAQTVVCPGVTLKSHSILSVGSVATKDLEAYGIYQGIPAVKVRERVISE
ncbi:MAG: WcaF family extracellular polysaccharide biosynthesis acetyltransferase [Bacteroidia bacterium]|nr:WcaF family extracellular polysaccharide biosynthesis acetyltransferase [Bacteroidia bacterium]